MNPGAAKCAVLVAVFDRIEPETQDSLRALASRGYAIRAFIGCSQPVGVEPVLSVPLNGVQLLLVHI